MVTVSAYAQKLVRTRAEQQMLDTISILRGNLSTLDVSTGQFGGLTGARVIYAGKARIRLVSGGATLDLGSGEIDTRQTLISIPIDSPVPHRDDLVKVDPNDPNDTNLDGRIFRVMEVEGGSLFGDARVMSCTSWYESRYWGTQ